MFCRHFSWKMIIVGTHNGSSFDQSAFTASFLMTKPVKNETICLQP